MRRAGAVAAAAAALGACTWDLERMNDQPRCEPGDRGPWLPDARCDQDPPAGTVARGAALAPPPRPAPTRAIVLRGRDRYDRVCAPCHGALGDGRSVIALDMTLRPPPSLHTDTVVRYPDERLFEVIGQGYGLMPGYAYQLVPADRWAVVHYVRALQRSQSAGLADLSPEHRREAARWLR